MAKTYKEEPYDPVKANKLIDILENLPTGKWIKARYLSPMCGIQETQLNNYSKIRTLARQVTKHNGIPIVAGNRGFKIAEIEKDIEDYAKKMYSEVKGHHERIENVRLAWDIYEPGKREGAEKLFEVPIIKKPKRLILKQKPEQMKIFDKSIDYIGG